MILTTAAFAAALISLLPVRSWPVELLVSFRVQIITVCFGSAAIAFLVRLRGWAVAGVLFALAQIGLSLPPLVSAEHEPATSADTPLSLLTMNVEWSNRDARGVIDMIRREKPDVIALQEVDWWWRRQLEELADEYPTRLFDGAEDRAGVALLALQEPTSVEWYPLCGRATLTVLFDDGGRGLRLVNVHTYPPKTPKLFDVRNRMLDTVAARLPVDDVPTVVAGDLNTTPWSPVLRDFGRTTGLRSVRAGRGALPTWPSWNRLIGVPIDHVYLSDGFAVEDLSRVTVPGSDHYGLLVRLRPPSARG